MSWLDHVAKACERAAASAGSVASRAADNVTDSVAAVASSVGAAVDRATGAGVGTADEAPATTAVADVVMPVKLEAAELDATGNDIAVASLDLDDEGMSTDGAADSWSAPFTMAAAVAAIPAVEPVLHEAGALDDLEDIVGTAPPAIPIFDANATFEGEKYAGSLDDLDASPYRLEALDDDVLAVTTSPDIFDPIAAFEGDKYAGSLDAPYRLEPPDDILGVASTQVLAPSTLDLVASFEPGKDAGSLDELEADPYRLEPLTDPVDDVLVAVAAPPLEPLAHIDGFAAAEAELAEAPLDDGFD